MAVDLVDLVVVLVVGVPCDTSSQRRVNAGRQDRMTAPRGPNDLSRDRTWSSTRSRTVSHEVPDTGVLGLCLRR